MADNSSKCYCPRWIRAFSYLQQVPDGSTWHQVEASKVWMRVTPGELAVVSWESAVSLTSLGLCFLCYCF